jgi:hypothetical protein
MSGSISSCVTPSPGLAKALGQIGVAVRPTFLSSKDAARVNGSSAQVSHAGRVIGVAVATLIWVAMTPPRPRAPYVENRRRDHDMRRPR